MPKADKVTVMRWPMAVAQAADERAAELGMSRTALTIWALQRVLTGEEAQPTPEAVAESKRRRGRKRGAE